MEIHGIVWAGVRTERFRETTSFFRDIMGLPLHQLEDDFAWFTLPDSSQLEIFGPGDADHRHFQTGPVPSFHTGTCMRRSPSSATVVTKHSVRGELRHKGGRISVRPTATVMV